MGFSTRKFKQLLKVKELETNDDIPNLDTYDLPPFCEKIKIEFLKIFLWEMSCSQKLSMKIGAKSNFRGLELIL